jgi:hypothetical protein
MPEMFLLYCIGGCYWQQYNMEKLYIVLDDNKIIVYCTNNKDNFNNYKDLQYNEHKVTSFLNNNCKVKETVSLDITKNPEYF